MVDLKPSIFVIESNCLFLSPPSFLGKYLFEDLCLKNKKMPLENADVYLDAAKERYNGVIKFVKSFLNVFF